MGHREAREGAARQGRIRAGPQADPWATAQPAMRAESAQQATNAGWGNQPAYEEPAF